MEIIKQLSIPQGKKQNIDGYYFPDYKLVSSSMRPSKLFNKIIDNL